MSISQVVKVWEHEFSHAQQSIMLALADYAHDDGSGIWPSVDRVAWKTGYSRRQVQRIQKELKESGVLVVTREATHDMPTVMKIEWSAATKKQPFIPAKNRGDNMTPQRGDNLSQGVTNTTGRGDKYDTLGVTPMSPDPSSKPSVKPSPPTPSSEGKKKGHEYRAGITPYHGSSQFMEERPWIAKWEGNRTQYPIELVQFAQDKMKGWGVYSGGVTLGDAKNHIKKANFDTPASQEKLSQVFGWWEELTELQGSSRQHADDRPTLTDDQRQTLISIYNKDQFDLTYEEIMLIDDGFKPNIKPDWQRNVRFLAA